MELTEKQAKATAIYYIEDDKVKNSNLLDFVYNNIANQDLCYSYFVNKEEIEEPFYDEEGNKQIVKKDAFFVYKKRDGEIRSNGEYINHFLSEDKANDFVFNLYFSREFESDFPENTYYESEKYASESLAEIIKSREEDGE